MEDIFLSAEVGDRTLCVSPLAKSTYLASGGKGLGGDFGYFIYEYFTSKPNAGIEILAKAASLDAAMRLFSMLRVQQEVAA